MQDEPPKGTITGLEGLTIIEPGVEFTPTSAQGDGTLHVDETLAGFVYASLRYHDVSSSKPGTPAWSFTVLDRDHREIMTFDEQGKAIDFLVQLIREPNPD